MALAAEWFEDVRKLRVTRDVFIETLRLYPTVPMMLRETVQQESFRGRLVARGRVRIENLTT